MANYATAHPFVIGEQYRTEIGVYTVIQIEGGEMVIQYDDGARQTASVELMARIWERIQLEDELTSAAAAIRKASRSRGSSRSRSSYGRDFEGLKETDFSDDLAGSSWRRREELGGLLAERLSGISGETFESHAVPRRPQIHIVHPHHYHQKLHVAKFVFELSEAEAFYGFYIEKSDKPMDDTWDWLRFTARIETDKSLQARALVAMEGCKLRWTINVETPDVETPDDEYVVAEQETLYLQEKAGGERTPIGWDGFSAMLAAIPAGIWCNLYLAAQMEKAPAIEHGVALATDVANVYAALLPLYEASVRR